jgi:putative phosphoesterase
MRIAVIADVHGILPGLEVALDEISREGVEGLIVAGDMVAGPNPEEVVNRLREHKTWMIRGNNEEYVLGLASGKAPGWWFTCKQWAFIRWNHERLSAGSLEFLSTLPDQTTVRVDGTDPIRVVHGSPRNVSDLIYPDRDITKLDAVLPEIVEPVAVFGHTHEDWQMNRMGKLALNPGSVSMYFKGEHCGTYSILSWEQNHWEAELRKVYYDFQLLEKAYIEGGLLEEGNHFSRACLASVKTGVNYLPPLMHYAYQMARQAGYEDSPYVPDELWDEACSAYEEQNYKGVL